MKRTQRPGSDVDESPSGKLKDPSKSRVEYPELEFEDPYEDSFESESMEEGSEHESEEYDSAQPMLEEDEEEQETEVSNND